MCKHGLSIKIPYKACCNTNIKAKIWPKIMCISAYLCTCVQDMKFLWLNLWSGGASTDGDYNANDDDNDDTRRTIHDCMGSLAFMPNEQRMKLILSILFNVLSSTFFWSSLQLQPPEKNLHNIGINTLYFKFCSAKSLTNKN